MMCIYIYIYIVMYTVHIIIIHIFYMYIIFNQVPYFVQHQSPIGPVLSYPTHVFLRPGGGFHVTRPALEFGGRYCWSTIWWWMQLSFRSDLGNSGALLRDVGWSTLKVFGWFGLSKMIQPRFMFYLGFVRPILVLIWFDSSVLEGFRGFFWQIRRLQEAFLFLLMHGLSCARKLR